MALRQFKKAFPEYLASAVDEALQRLTIDMLQVFYQPMDPAWEELLEGGFKLNQRSLGTIRKRLRKAYLDPRRTVTSTFESMLRLCSTGDAVAGMLSSRALMGEGSFAILENYYGTGTLVLGMLLVGGAEGKSVLEWGRHKGAAGEGKGDAKPEQSPLVKFALELVDACESGTHEPVQGCRSGKPLKDIRFLFRPLLSSLGLDAEVEEGSEAGQERCGGGEGTASAKPAQAASGSGDEAQAAGAAARRAKDKAVERLKREKEAQVRRADKAEADLRDERRRREAETQRADEATEKLAAAQRQASETEARFQKVDAEKSEVVRRLDEQERARKQAEKQFALLKEAYAKLTERNLALESDAKAASSLASSSGRFSAMEVLKLMQVAEEVSAGLTRASDKLAGEIAQLRTRLHEIAVPAAAGTAASPPSAAGEGALPPAAPEKRQDEGIMFIIDGHNVINTMPEYQRLDAQGMAHHAVRERFARDCAALASKIPGMELRLYFDGPERTQAQRTRNMSIRYSGGIGEHRADNAIVAEAEIQTAVTNGRRVVVVTDDRELRNRVKAANGEYVPVADFIARLRFLGCLH